MGGGGVAGGARRFRSWRSSKEGVAGTGGVREEGGVKEQGGVGGGA